MADEKKSFLIYCDLIHTVRKMKKEDVGELFLHILEYTNDYNPITENQIVELVFEPIKQQLKRDLKSWEFEKEQSSIKGRIGNLKRWNNDLFLKFELKEISLDEAESIAKHRKASPPDKKDTSPNEIVANIAVTDTVIVNDTVTVTSMYKAEKAIEICLRDLEWISEVEKNYNLKSEHFIVAFNDFKSHCISIGKNEDRTIFDFKYHFVNWVKKKKEAKEKSIVKDKL